VGQSPSLETRAKISATLQGHEVSEETREKLRAAKLGSRHSDASRAKTSASLKGREMTAEHRSALSAAMKGRKPTREVLEASRRARTVEFTEAERESVVARYVAGEPLSDLGPKGAVKRALAEAGITVKRRGAYRRGICPMCEREGFLHRDHCHDSGVQREVICGRCNMALGLLADDPALLRRLAEYLERYQIKRESGLT
jgi:hypothetical protein